MENYSSSWETAALMKMAVVLMEKPSGALPVRRAGTETLSPDLGFAMAAARKERDEPHTYRYSPEPQWRTTPLMGDSSVDEDGGGVDGEAFRGTSPSGGVPEQTPVPDLGFAMAAALEGFSYRGFSVSRF
ncbi:hypothetical protein QYE76_057603 [Lolium multiflorum]|uniref:Uncharacterized protein n=1 Tax=Lolium multiflorum TaxID=4521 RepID=A0AAD8WNY5_LOLMU|nr:hypothetical protein QYE76_057603 [Lolium multiflorum]